MKFRPKNQMNVLLSHFLNNGLDVISTQLGINRSEVMRMALYNLLKDTYTKKELDIFASRDDIVDEWIEWLQAPGRPSEFNSKILAEENKEKRMDLIDKYQSLFEYELDERIKPIKKKYAFIQAEEFLKNTNMGPDEAKEYFKNYDKKSRDEFLDFQKDLKNYFNKDFPGELKEIEDKLEKLTGKKRGEMELKVIDEYIDYMIQYHQDGVKAYAHDKKQCEFEKQQLRKWQEIKDDHERIKILNAYKKKYLKKYSDDPGLIEAINNCNDIESFEKIRGVRNPEAVRQILSIGIDDALDYDDVIEKKKEVKKRYVKKKT